jgi:hypothetical protein
MQAPQTILSGASATGWSTSIRMDDYRHAVISLATSGLGVGKSVVLKVAHSYKKDAPDFTAAKSVTNPWAYVQTFDLEGGPGINGNDGLTISGADDVKHLELNQNSASWVAVQIASIDVGVSVTAECILSEE